METIGLRSAHDFKRERTGFRESSRDPERCFWSETVLSFNEERRSRRPGATQSIVAMKFAVSISTLTLALLTAGTLTGTALAADHDKACDGASSGCKAHLSAADHKALPVLKELLQLMTRKQLSAEEAAKAAMEALASSHGGSAADGGEGAALTESVFNQLGDFLAEGEKVDELHAQLQDISPEPLPDFPYDDKSVNQSAASYYGWVSNLLAHMNPNEGGYALVSIDPGEDSSDHVVIARRRDVPRILQLAHQLSLKVSEETGKD